MIALIDTFNNKVLSIHRTAEAAENADGKLQSAVRRANGSSSYIPTVLVEATGFRKGEYVTPEKLAASKWVGRSWES